jgi:DNA repair exonuclease SbcCD ATPase subunit
MDPRGPAADALRQTTDCARDALEQFREGLRAADATRLAEVSEIGTRATQLVEELAAKIADELSADVARQHEAATSGQRHEIQQQLAALQADRDALQADRDAVQADREALAADRLAWEAERDEWENVRKEVEAELSSIEQRLVQQAQNLQRERETGPSSGELLSQVQQATDARIAAESELADTQHQLSQLSAELEERTRALAESVEAAAELATLREKFEMALADLQSHRGRVADLEGELASRPSPEHDPAEELERLRQERDDLARRLEEANEFADPAQEMEDLHARFQMAVEDLRELKTENAELRERLGRGGVPSSSDSGGNDWESQKRRLLAALESEGESSEPSAPRQEERASIAGTIQITDAVVAEKDAEIQRLREQLANAPEVEVVAPQGGDTALLDNDEVIRAERQRLAQLEEEWREKIRSAELELSVERAKIARAQSELADRQMELETLRSSGGGGLAPGEGRRNWFNKLGLGNDGAGN